MHTLLSIRVEFEQAGHVGRASVIKEAHERIEKLEQEIIKMARVFTEATAVVLDHDAKATTDNVTLTDANVKLLADLAAAQANAQTPEILAAQQAIIDRAEVISPTLVAGSDKVPAGDLHPAQAAQANPS